jgi:hypothetical protein
MDIYIGDLRPIELIIYNHQAIQFYAAHTITTLFVLFQYMTVVRVSLDLIESVNLWLDEGMPKMLELEHKES